MVKQDIILDKLFHALADPTRRAMLAHLSRSERSIGELAAPHEMSLTAVSKHVRVLEEAGLVKRRVEGRSHILNIEPQAMKSAEQWLTSRRTMWERHFDQLESYLAATEPQPKGDKK